MTTLTQGMYVEGRYVPAGPWADAKIKSQVQHLKSSFRTGEKREEERTLFDAHGTVADVAAARAILTAAIGPKVVFHRLILAPGRRGGLVRLIDLHTCTRLVLMDLGHALGQRLVWVAAVHRNTDEPHIHVLLAGAAVRTQWPGHGTTTSVELRTPQYALVRERGDVRAAEIRALNGDGTAA